MCLVSRNIDPIDSHEKPKANFIIFMHFVVFLSPQPSPLDLLRHASLGPEDEIIIISLKKSQIEPVTGI